MLSILFLLFPLLAPAWEKPFTDIPRSVLYIVAHDEIAVGLELPEGRGRIVYLDTKGFPTVRKAAELEEWPRALRVHGSDLYALGGKAVWRVDLLDGEVVRHAELPMRCTDFAVDRDTSLFCGGSDGFFWRKSGKGWARLSTEPVDGIFLVSDAIHVLRGDRVEKAGEKTKAKGKGGTYRQLVKASDGSWLSLGNKGVYRSKKGRWRLFRSFPERTAQLSYIYRVDPADDMVLVVLSGSRRVVSFPAAEKR